jgi:oligopeptide transport system permease protein
MILFLLGRLIQGAGVVLAVLCLTFLLLRQAPGGPFQGERAVSEALQQRQAAHYGLDQPVAVQLWRHVVNFVRFDFPPSPKIPGLPVSELIRQSFPISAAVGLAALCIALALGIPAGALPVLYPWSLRDRLCRWAAALGICMPSLVLGPVLALLLGLKLHWFNVSGWHDADDWVLPALTLGLVQAAYIAQLTRAGLQETLLLDCMRTARAKGVSELRIVCFHAFKMACLPLLNYLGPAAAGLITGSMVVETVFQIPGLGQHFVAAAINRNYELAMATAAFYAVWIVFFNVLVDGLQWLLNPRQRSTGVMKL